MAILKGFYEYFAAIVILLLYEFICYKFVLLKTPLHGDEHHFYSTIVEFSKGLSIGKIRGYNELITPLTFILYGFFGKIFGTDLHTLRILSLIIGFITHLVFFIFLKENFREKLIYWLLFLIWIINPYVLGFNALVFTDGLSNLLILLFLFAFYKGKYFLIFVVSALLLHTRQFNLIIIAAALFHVFIELIKRKTFHKKLFISLLAGCLAILPLFLLWKGLSPVGAMSNKLDNVPFTFYFESLPVYIYCIFIYTLPVSFWVLYCNKISRYWWSVIISFTFLVYVLFPVMPSFIAIKDHFFTVGLYDKLITLILKENVLKHIVLYISFLLGTAILYLLSRKYWIEAADKESKNDGFDRFAFLYLISFLLAMVMNFQIWEKYFTQVLPVVLALIGNLLQMNLPQLSDNFKRLGSPKI